MLQSTQKKKGENPFQKREERKERKGNHGCFSSHRTSGHRQHQTLRRTVLPQVVRQQEEDRRIREETVTVVNLHTDNSTGQEAQEDDEGAADEREIWQVTDVTEEDFETTEGESVDLYDKLMAMAGWTVRDHALT